MGDLIAELCPNGVDHKALGEVGQFTRGNGLQKKDLVDQGIGAVHYGQIYTHYGTATSVTKSFVPPQLAATLRKARTGDLIVTTTSENIEDVGKSLAWLGDAEIVIGGHSCVYAHTLEPLYVAYFSQTDDFQRQKRRFVKGTKVKEIATHELARIRIPVPPLEIQREIVRILTKMEQLEAELEAALEAELEARRTQYVFYRDQLTFAERDGVRWVGFGEVATIVRGGSPRPIQAYLTDSDDGVNWIKIGDVAANSKYITATSEKIRADGVSKSRQVRPGDFVLSNSMSFGRPYIVQIDGCIHDGWLAIKDFDGSFNSDFLYHLLRSQPVRQQMAQKASSGTVQNLNADIVRSLQLPVPEQSEQMRIAGILDRLDALVTELSLALPAERRGRRKQYGYYRDRLLTFEEVPA